MEIRQAALAAFITTVCDDKIAQVAQLPSHAPLPGQGPEFVPPTPWHLQASAQFPTLETPGRPERPHLIAPEQMPHRKGHQLLAHAALVHAICHIEFNAINLALDAIWRFPDMPDLYYWQWARVAVEEARHFQMLRDHLRGLPVSSTGDAQSGRESFYDYGDFPAHDGLWEMCLRTQHDVVARMALVPRTLEARGLDATPLIQKRLQSIATPWAQAALPILDTLLRDEIGHVAIGNYWYRWLCERQGLHPIAHYKALSALHRAPRLKPPFNNAARRMAGFDDQEMEDLQCNT